jgi:glutamyl-tRNA synthetase
MAREVRVRIAPSPTGYLHIGTARTALFNWLFARKHKGVFILRIEDTDRERSKPAFEKDILESLTWLGLTSDEGPYRQSERAHIYERYLSKLLHESLAYHCFCSKEELEAERQSMLAEGVAPRYSGKCRSIPRDEVEARMAKGNSSVIRFKVPSAKVSFTDMIRGKVSFDMSLGGDFVIAKNVREPLYNFAVVVDDGEMRISHVIRGEDHLANTPKQIVLRDALGFPPIQYAHLPLILDSSRAKMSKRYSATAIAEYRSLGYLPEAILNFLVLLGWHPGEGSGSNQELFSRAELIEAFDVERVQKAGAVFNLEKLDWMNSQYVRKLSLGELADLLTEQKFAPAGIAGPQLKRAILAVRDRMQKLSDFPSLSDFFFTIPEYPSELLSWKDAPRIATLENLIAANAVLAGLSPEAFNRAKDLEHALATVVAERGRGPVLWPLRVALSGREASPGPFDIMATLGKDATLERIGKAIEKLKDDVTAR